MGLKEYEHARQEGLDAAQRFYAPNDLDDLVFGLGGVVCHGLVEMVHEPVGETAKRVVREFRTTWKKEGPLPAVGYVSLDLALTVLVQAVGLPFRIASKIEDWCYNKD